MALVKCPDCGRSLSEKALICPKCGRPNDGDFDIIEKGKIQKRLLYGILCLGVIVLLLYVYATITQPSTEDSLFYMIKYISHEEVIEKYGKPSDITEMDSYFEYIYENVKFMNIEGKLVFRFSDDGSSGNLIYARWIIDGAKYSEKKIEKVSTFFDNIYGKRNVQNSGNYEWNNLAEYEGKFEEERIFFHKPKYSGGFYDFEYRPW